MPLLDLQCPISDSEILTQIQSILVQTKGYSSFMTNVSASPDVKSQDEHICCSCFPTEVKMQILAFKIITVVWKLPGGYV